MTKYLKEIINDEVFMQALILNGVIEMRELVQEVIAKGEAYYIYKVAKIIDSLPEKDRINKELKKELIKELEKEIIKVNEGYIVDFLINVKGADMEFIITSLIDNDILIDMDKAIEFVYNLKDLKVLASFYDKAKIKRYDLLFNMLSKLIEKRNYDMVINIIKNVNDNDELLDIVININDLEFLNYFANYIESLISKTTDYEEKLKLELLIRRFNLPYRLLHLEGSDLESKFRILINLYNKKDFATIAHYKEEFAPLFSEFKEEEKLTR